MLPQNNSNINWKMFISIFTAFLTICVILIGLYNLFDKNFILVFIVGLLLIGLLSFIGSVYLSKKFGTKSEIKNEKKAIYEVGSDITSLVKELDKPSDILKLRVIRGRFGLEQRKFNDIGKGKWTLLALDKNSYFVYIFRQVVSNLKRGDKYLAVTSINFWEKDISDEELLNNGPIGTLSPIERKSFLNVCNSAIERGVIIKRYFIVDNDQIKNNPDGEYCNKLKREIKRVNRYKELSKNYKDYARKDMCIFHDGDNEYFFYLSNDYENDIEKGHVFGLISNKDSNSFLSIVSDLKSSTPKVDLRFFNNETNAHYSKYKGIYLNYKNAHPDKLLNINQISKLIGLPNS